MSDDLATVLRGFVDAEGSHASATAPEPSREAGVLAGRVSRRRVVRTGASALTAVALIVALGLGVHSLQRFEPGPALPAPPVSAHPSPSPAGSSTATDVPAVTTPPLLPVVEPMEPGMLEAADGTWRVLRYQGWTQMDGAPSPASVYLLGPDGRTYQVPTASDPAGWYLLDWLPGTTLAIVQMTQTAPTRVIDLISGATVLERGSSTTGRTTSSTAAVARCAGSRRRARSARRRRRPPRPAGPGTGCSARAAPPSS
jgi:hypothetical protein